MKTFALTKLVVWTNSITIIVRMQLLSRLLQRLLQHQFLHLVRFKRPTALQEVGSNIQSPVEVFANHARNSSWWMGKFELLFFFQNLKTKSFFFQKNKQIKYN